MSEGCIEPLCDNCVEQHRTIHRKSGFPPKITEYSEVMENIKKLQKKVDEESYADETMKDILPRSAYIKDLTRQYFAERAKRKDLNHGSKVEIKGLLSDLEIWESMRSKPVFKKKVAEFLKENLTVNKDVVGKDYSHLYE